jgi:hypothetical protein
VELALAVELVRRQVEIAGRAERQRVGPPEPRVVDQGAELVRRGPDDHGVVLVVSSSLARSSTSASTLAL